MSWGGGGGGVGESLDENFDFSIFPQKWRDKCTEAWRKQDLRLITHNMNLMIKNKLGDYAFMPPKLILFFLIWRKKKKSVS